MKDQDVALFQLIEQHTIHKPAFEIDFWNPKNIGLIHQHLELPNWAPWLAASLESMTGRSDVFPEGQLVVWDNVNSLPAASLSLNRISWNKER